MPESYPASSHKSTQSHSEEVIVAFRSPSRRKGFAQIPTAVLLDKTISDSAKVLYGLLVSYAMQTGSFKGNQAGMAEDINKGERTVRTLLKELSARGLVTPHRQGVMLPNIYFIEDAYALYDAEQPKVKKPVRRSPLAAESDRKKTSGHCGQKLPVITAENGRLLKNLNTKNQKKESGDLPAASPEKTNPPPTALEKFRQSPEAQQFDRWRQGKR